jgi:hypothetical protein
MGEFKLMPKMKTTEPSAILKLKKGGSVKKAMGGVLPVADSEKGVSMAARRGVAPAMPKRGSYMGGMPMRPETGPVMRKEGGETKATHKAEMKAIKGIKSELSSHEGKPASKAHKGLKTGGVINGYKTGGVTNGYKTGGIADVEGKNYKRGGKANC